MFRKFYVFSRQCHKGQMISITDMKNRLESVAFTGSQVAEQITKVSTVVAQQEKSWAAVASGGSKGRTLDNNVLATEVAKKVDKEMT